jgi:nicotinate-nucleotide pyrophosphorylase
MTSETAPPRRVPHHPGFKPAADILSGETADVYFERARTILAAERLDPVVTMEIFPRGDGILCGAEESATYLRQIFAEARGDPEPIVESLHDGDPFTGREVVMRIS